MKVISPIKLIITLVSLFHGFWRLSILRQECKLHRQGHISASPAISSTDKGEDVESDSQAHCFSQLHYDKYNLPLLGLTCR